MITSINDATYVDSDYVTAIELCLTEHDIKKARTLNVAAQRSVFVHTLNSYRYSHAAAYIVSNKKGFNGVCTYAGVRREDFFFATDDLLINSEFVVRIEKDWSGDDNCSIVLRDGKKFETDTLLVHDILQRLKKCPRFCIKQDVTCMNGLGTLY